MDAAWAAVLVAALVFVFGAIGTIIGFLMRGARREGRVDAVLEQLAEITADHEKRLRRGRL